MSITTSIWEIEPHTLAKHAILRNYLNAWLPIMTSWNGRVIFIDGFAGPGEYKRGEPGSPKIALEAALGQRQTIRAEVKFIFIEAMEERYKYLKHMLNSLYKSRLPSNLSYIVICAKFDETLSTILDYLEEKKSIIAPTFAFIDPFGYSDTPFHVIERLMKHSKCEVLINFNYEELNRFLSVESQWAHFDKQFGTSDWRKALIIQEPHERHRYLHDLYKYQLEKVAGITFVRSFQMKNKGNRTDYFLFFGSQAYQGLRQMKHAMWRMDPTGTYSFFDRRDFNQPYLIEPEPDYNLLKHLIIQQFRGQGTFDEQELEQFVIVQTPFLDTHYKKRILISMEKAGELKIVSSPRKRRFTYPVRTIFSLPS